VDNLILLITACYGHLTISKLMNPLVSKVLNIFNNSRIQGTTIALVISAHKKKPTNFMN
jgi:hypothetical protein